MIKGVGTDICRIGRIEKMLAGSRRQLFLDKTFTAEEQSHAIGKKNEAAYFAGRWAAKEAISKALATGIGAHCGFLDISIKRLESGAPQISLSGNADETSRRLGITNWHLSISHEKEYAVAFVTAEG